MLPLFQNFLKFAWRHSVVAQAEIPLEDLDQTHTWTCRTQVRLVQVNRCKFWHLPRIGDLSRWGALKSQSPIQDCYPPSIYSTGLPHGFFFLFLEFFFSFRYIPMTGFLSILRLCKRMFLPFRRWNISSFLGCKLPLLVWRPVPKSPPSTSVPICIEWRKLMFNIRNQVHGFHEAGSEFDPAIKNLFVLSFCEFRPSHYQIQYCRAPWYWIFFKEKMTQQV